MDNTQEKQKMGLITLITWNEHIKDQINIIGTVLEEMQATMQDYLAHFPVAPPIPRIRLSEGEDEQETGTPYNVSLILEVCLQTLADRLADVSHAVWTDYTDNYERVRNTADSPDTTRKVYLSEVLLGNIDVIGTYIENNDLPPSRHGMRFRTTAGYNRRLIVFLAICHATDVIERWNKQG